MQRFTTGCRTPQLVALTHANDGQRWRRGRQTRRARRIGCRQTCLTPLDTRQPGLQWRRPQGDVPRLRSRAPGIDPQALLIDHTRSSKPTLSGWSWASSVGGVVPSSVQAKRWRRQLPSLRASGCPNGQQMAATPTEAGTAGIGAVIPRWLSRLLSTSCTCSINGAADARPNCPGTGVPSGRPIHTPIR